jgi:hypothetical protein
MPEALIKVSRAASSRNLYAFVAPRRLLAISCKPQETEFK